MFDDSTLKYIESLTPKFDQPSYSSEPAVTTASTPTQKITEDGNKYSTITVSEIFDENTDLGKDILLEKIEREKESSSRYSPDSKMYKRSEYASKLLGTQLTRIETPDGKIYYQTPRGEQIEKSEFLRVMQSTGKGVSVGGSGYSFSPSATYIALTGEGLEGRTEKDKSRATITHMEGTMHVLSPTSAGLESEYAEIEERNIEHELGENVVRLNNGQYITENQFNSITDPQLSNIILTQGIDAYNTEIQQRLESSIRGLGGEPAVNYLRVLQEMDAKELEETGVAGTNVQTYLSQLQTTQEIDIQEYALKAGGEPAVTYLKQLQEEDAITLRETGVSGTKAQEYLNQLQTTGQIDIEGYVLQLGGEPAVTYLKQLQEEDARTLAETNVAGTKVQEYLKQLQTTQQIDIQEFRNQMDIQDARNQRVLTDIEPYVIKDDNGNPILNSNGEKQYNPYQITQEDLQNNPTLKSSVELAFPDIDTSTLGIPVVDYQEYKDKLGQSFLGSEESWRLREGRYPVDQQIQLDYLDESYIGKVYTNKNTGEMVLVKQPMPIAQYIQGKLDEVNSGIKVSEIERKYYPTVTMTEYANYGPNAIAKIGAVVKPTFAESIRYMANVNPDMTTELSLVDAAKLFGYGFVTAFALESALALPFVASSLPATIGLGLASMGTTPLNWSHMSPTEKRTSLVVDGLFTLLIFGAALKALSYIPRELRSIFGDIGANTLLNKTTILSNALRETQGLSEVVAIKNIKTAATDLKNLLVAARDNGVQGLDRLIDRVELIRRNPVAFKNVGSMGLTPELEGILKEAETALRQVEAGTYKPVLMATEQYGGATAEKIGTASEKWDIPKLWEDITKSYQLRTYEEASRASAINRESIGLDIPTRDISEARFIKPDPSAETFRLQSWLRSERTGEQYPRTLAEFRETPAGQFINRMRSSDLYEPSVVDAIESKYHYLWNGINNSAEQSARYWVENQAQIIYKDLVTQYAERELAEQPIRQLLMEQVRIAVAKEAETARNTAIALQNEVVQTKIAQLATILRDADTLTPNTIAFLLNQGGLSAMALAIFPEKVLRIASKLNPEVRNQFINQLGLSDISTINKVIENYDWSESDLSTIQSQAQSVVDSQLAITQEDLTQIIAVPMATPITDMPIQTISDVPIEQVTTTPVNPITDVPIEYTTDIPPSVVKAQEWEAPTESPTVRIQEWATPSIKEWTPSYDDKMGSWKLKELGLPSITEITMPELTHLNDTIKKVKADNDITKTTYTTNLMMQMIIKAQEQWEEAERNAKSIEDLPFEQRIQAERALKYRKGVKDHWSNHIQFMLPLMLMIDSTTTIAGIQALPQDARMVLMEALPNTKEAEVVRTAVENPELSPELLEQIEEAAQDMWEKLLEEIVAPKGDVIASPFEIETEIEEIIRKVEQDGIVMPSELAEEIRRLLEEPFHIPKTVGTPEVVTIPQITPEGQQVGELALPSPMATPLTGTQTLTQTLTEALTNAMAQAKSATQSATQTAQQLAQQTQSGVQGQTQAQIQSRTQSQIQSQVQQQIAAQVQQQMAQQLAQQLATGTATKTATKIQTKLATEATTQDMFETQIEPITEIQDRTRTEIRQERPIETKIELITEVKPFEGIEPPKQTERFKTRIVKPPLLGAGGKKLTKEQLEGAIGWKQGIMFKYIYPPYGQEDIINSRTPIQGIPIKEGIRSAYETIIRTRKGTIPPNITRHMGMMDLVITDADKNGQPEIHFLEREVRKGRGAVAKKPTTQAFTIGT
jgi:hypothetical protein